MSVWADAPLSKRVGDKTARVLAEHLNLHTAADLLYYFPRRYEERGRHSDLSSLRVGDQVTVLAQVRGVTTRRLEGRRSLVTVEVGDDTGASLTCTFFNQLWRAQDLAAGSWGLFAGKVSEFRYHRRLNNPDYVLLSDTDDAAEELEEFAGSVIPVYPATASVPTWVVGRCLRVVLGADLLPPDPLPDQLRARYGLIGLKQALREIHRPDSWQSVAAARHRLAWDEAFAVQLSLAQRKARLAARPAAPRSYRPDGLLAAFDTRLPYHLTQGQVRVGEEIARDLSQPHPMHRLLQGEVGSGKTLCALRAMLQVVNAGGQAAMLAPTEVLAVQHERSLRCMLGALGRAGELDGDADGTRVALVTGSLPASERRAALSEVASGRAGIVVGTHALLYEEVRFAELGLAVIDEQHRFGVEQRDALRSKAEHPPHVLVMTATPIPRTVAMTVFGDLEVLTLSELPGGRSPIATHVVPVREKPAYLDRAWRRLREEVEQGHQAYVVCPRIGEAAGGGAEAAGGGVDLAGGWAADEEDLPADELVGQRSRPPLAAVETAAALADGPLSGLRLGLLHGRLSRQEKETVMGEFVAGRLDVLVATTVVEVGVDVANATLMVVLDADRFGVSQLHQLRGRVGRGCAPGLCLLVTEALAGSPARERLDAVAATCDGFRLAELDLAQRREGDVLGAAQSGRRSSLKLLSLLRDAELIRQARAAAAELVAEDPQLRTYPALAAAVDTVVDSERVEYLEKG